MRRSRAPCSTKNALPYGTGYTMAMALTLASQEALLPVTDELLASHACLKSFPVVRDLRISQSPQMGSRETAWRWAIDHLLANASSDRVFNLYHFDPRYKSDPQSNATLAKVNLDLAVQNGAFVLDLRPEDPAGGALLAEIFAQLDPLFDAYGWAHDEHAWTEAVSKGGGVVLQLRLTQPELLGAAPSACGCGRPRSPSSPSSDSGRALDKAKYYVTWQTNEGDTPRIVVSAFGSSWASPSAAPCRSRGPSIRCWRSASPH